MSDAENPWLRVPAASYDAHMSAPGVGQAQMLADELAAALDRRRPKSLAVLGAATGNGFERLAGRGLERVVAVDINPDYLAILSERFAALLPGLEIASGDAADPSLIPGQVELIWAALIFEYVDPPRLLANCARWLAPGGVMTALLQLPAPESKVSASPWQADLAPIREVLTLVDVDAFRRMARAAGFEERPGSRQVTGGAKSFFVGDFARP